MPPTTPTGMHTPVTNMPPSEASISEELVVSGDTGFGDVLELASGAVTEPVARVGLESVAELSAPETEGLPDIGVASFGSAPSSKP